MYVCMYVCMHVCMYVCAYVCMYLCTYVCMYVYVCVCVCMYVCMCVCMNGHDTSCLLLLFPFLLSVAATKTSILVGNAAPKLLNAV